MILLKDYSVHPVFSYRFPINYIVIYSLDNVIIGITNYELDVMFFNADLEY